MAVRRKNMTKVLVLPRKDSFVIDWDWLFNHGLFIFTGIFAIGCLLFLLWMF